MNATIYIRQENQKRWESIADKSAWVNAYLAKSPPNSRVLEEGLEPAPVEYEVRAEATRRAISRDSSAAQIMGLCKHGADPRFCKFAKNGKPCK